MGWNRFRMGPDFGGISGDYIFQYDTKSDYENLQKKFSKNPNPDIIEVVQGPQKVAKIPASRYLPPYRAEISRK